MSGRRRDERGNAAIEVVVLVPGLMLILGLLLAGGRIWLARSVVTDAAYAAARAGSLARTAVQARSDAVAQGTAALDGGQLDCSSRVVQVDTTGFVQPVGRPASVRTSVTCVVALSDLVVPGLPGSMEIHGESAAALDTYRGR